MKRQHTCAVALMLGCVFATPSNARPDPQATIGRSLSFAVTVSVQLICPQRQERSNVAPCSVVIALRDRYYPGLVLSMPMAIRVMAS